MMLVYSIESLARVQLAVRVGTLSSVKSVFCVASFLMLQVAVCPSHCSACSL